MGCEKDGKYVNKKEQTLRQQVEEAKPVLRRKLNF